MFAISGLLGASALSACSGGTSGYLATSQVADSLTVNGIDLKAPSKLQFTVQPSDTIASDNIPVTVTLQTLSGATASGDLPVTISYSGGQGSAPAFVAQSVNGVATFNISISEAGPDYALTASAPGVTPATSNHFNILAGTAVSLNFLTQPLSVAAGGPINPSLQVEVLDSSHSLVANSTAPVTLTVSGGGKFTSSAQAIAVNGIASFPTLGISNVGTGYVLTATSGTLTSASSSAFNISAGGATKLVWSTQPINVAASDTMSPAPVVQVQDAGGNVVSGASNPITVTCNFCTSSALIQNGMPSSGALTVPFNSGVTKNGFLLTATAMGLSSAVSSAFNVGPGYATPALVHSAGANNTTSATTFTVPITATAAGHLIVVPIITTQPVTTIVRVTDNATGGSNTYVSANVESNDATDGKEMEIWYAKNSKAGATVVTITLTAASASDHAWVNEFSGIDLTAPLDAVKAVNTGAGAATITGGTVTTTLANELVVTAVGGTITAINTGNPFVALPLAGQPNGAAYYVAPTSGQAYGAVWTEPASAAFCTSTVSFKPAKL